MKKENVFIGTIVKCIEYKEKKEYIDQKSDYDKIIYSMVETYQELCPLLKIKGYYVNLEWINTPKKYIELYKFLCGIGSVPNFALDVFPKSKSEIFVLESSLCSYYSKSESSEKISIKKVKQDWVLDPRIKVGYDVGNDGIVLYKRKPFPKTK